MNTVKKLKRMLTDSASKPHTRGRASLRAVRISLLFKT